MALAEEILKRYWGFKSFRPLQGEVIGNILQGKDTLALMPTGGGKSLCFQVPALCKEGICIVITPLISLMKDQVEHLKEKHIPALAIHSGMSGREVEKAFKNALYGNFKLLYLSPERLRTSLFLDYIGDLHVNLITVDEAHCISQWGYDFRPAYLQIGELREHLPEVPLLAITATATKIVRADIQEKLKFRKKNVLIKSFFRENLSYTVFSEQAKLNKTIDILHKVSGSSIIFCKSRRRTREIASYLHQSGLQADFYHAGLDAGDRNQRQEAWIANETRIMVCTNAFGMGIDKPDVRTVIHYDVPDSPEAYYQEAGRAGRDGKRSYCVLLYNQHELKALEENIETNYPPLEKIREIYRAIVSYLQIPAGSGEGMYYDFDLNDFTKTFHLNIILVTHILKVLEQEEILTFTDSVLLSSRICFTVPKNELYRFEKENPALDNMVKCLLRTYEGIFNNYINVSEKQVSHMLKINEKIVVQQWHELQRYGILDFQPAKDKPQIYFMQERRVVDDLNLHMHRIHARKKTYEDRVHAMISYVENDKICRSKLLLTYFDESESLPCGICDVCIRKRQQLKSSQQKQVIYEEIKERLTEGAQSVNELLAGYSSLKKESVLLILREMLDEEEIRINKVQKMEWRAENH
ncbi:MAG: RecQ family ATP-dependent DNA helicase [Chitinophagaceae bacterium]|nr:MAG: RecQ family ATP-dependent DNA helicase [Chitinophagaceae bacterium]